MFLRFSTLSSIMCMHTDVRTFMIQLSLERYCTIGEIGNIFCTDCNQNNDISLFNKMYIYTHQDHDSTRYKINV